MMTLEQLKQNYPGDWVSMSNIIFYIKYPDFSYIKYDAQGFYYDKLGDYVKIIGKDEVNGLIKKKNSLINFI